jgi:hypothetical protein
MDGLSGGESGFCIWADGCEGAEALYTRTGPVMFFNSQVPL